VAAREGWPVSISLRPYQQDMIRDFRRLVGARSILTAVPTNDRKTIIAAAIVTPAAAVQVLHAGKFRSRTGFIVSLVLEVCAADMANNLAEEKAA
jgi:hypothetical protein